MQISFVGVNCDIRSDFITVIFPNRVICRCCQRFIMLDNFVIIGSKFILIKWVLSSTRWTPSNLTVSLVHFSSQALVNHFLFFFSVLLLLTQYFLFYPATIIGPIFWLVGWYDVKFKYRLVCVFFLYTYILTRISVIHPTNNEPWVSPLVFWA